MTSSPSPAIMEFLAAQPPERRRELGRVRETILRNLPRGYEEALAGKILAYQVPLAAYPDTYNGHPLWYIGLAAQKHYLSLYLMCAYGSPEHLRRLKDGFKAAGKKLDMGKSCIRFKSADDLPLDIIGELVASIPMKRWIAFAKAVRKR
ncbi:MAG TPA: DUF1801 domain-containing protein [Gemmatimonadales bacterium]|jgi:hypothetical protein|nr:DUF1801 domain-containing protein [Gemmatimonadales bacterium]